MTNEDYMIRQAVELGMLRAQVREFRRCLNMVMDEAEGCGDSEFAHVKARTVQTIALMLLRQPVVPETQGRRWWRMPEHREPEATYERTIARLTAQRDALAAALRPFAEQEIIPDEPEQCPHCAPIVAARAALAALEEA